jgi:hypothetical protein
MTRSIPDVRGRHVCCLIKTLHDYQIWSVIRLAVAEIIADRMNSVGVGGGDHFLSQFGLPRPENSRSKLLSRFNS